MDAPRYRAMALGSEIFILSSTSSATGDPPWPSAPFAMGTNLSSAPEMAAAMKAFIARGSAPRHARFMGAIGVGKTATGRGSRRVEVPIDRPSATLFFAAAAGAFGGGAGAGAGRAGAGAGAGAATGLAGAGVLGGAGLGSLEPLLPIEVGGEGRSKRRNLSRGARREAKKIATDRESSTASRCSSTRERRVTRPGAALRSA